MNLQNQAMEYAEMGWHPVPVVITYDADGDKQVLPLIEWGAVESTEYDAVEAMPWSRASHIAIVLERSGVAIVDVDDMEQLGTIDPDKRMTAWQDTNHGRHLLYQPPTFHIGRQIKPIPGIDLLSEGLMIIWGKANALMDALAPWPLAPIDLPKRKITPLQGEPGFIGVVKGGRNTDLLRERRRFVNANPTASLDEIICYLLGYTKTTHRPPLSDEEVIGKASEWEGRYREPEASYTLLNFSEVMQLPMVDWLIKGILVEKGVNVFYGSSGAGKSFIAIDAGIAIATGSAWCGRKTQQRPVVYLALEGQVGIRQRLKAWSVAHGEIPPDSFVVFAGQAPFALNNAEHLEAMAKSISAAGLLNPVLVMDTFAQATPGMVENSHEDMSLSIVAIKALMTRINGTVLLIHHAWKDASRGLRGHSGLGAAVDSHICVDYSEAGRSWYATKIKDGSDSIGMGFSLTVVDTGEFDKDGDVITSCVPCYSGVPLVCSPHSKKQKTRPSGKVQTAIWQGCEKILETRLVLPAEDLVDALLKAGTYGSKKSNISRTVDKLIDDGFLKKDLAGGVTMPI